MASIREREKADGTKYWSVLYRLDGKQKSTSFGDFAEASTFMELAKKFGIENALAAVQVHQRVNGRSTDGFTVTSWLTHHVDHLTGVDRNTLAKYRAYIRNDVDDILGAMPMAAVTRDDIAKWVQRMQLPDAMGKVARPKTVTNKHGFVAGAFNGAVAAGHIPANPCTGMGMPRDDDPTEMVCLTLDQFQHLLANVTEFWRPLVEFLVASGCRWGEAAALRPADIDIEAGTVRITRSWKQGSDGYRLGATKTRKSKRTINVPASVLKKLDMSQEYVFVNRAGGPVRAQGFHNRVWRPAVEKAWPSVDKDGKAVKSPLRPRPHDLRHTNASWMILKGVPLPVVQAHLGHEDIRTTVATYGHLDRSSMQAAADAISDILATP
ncbi:tyrosine-type recombinase/integrase [Mycolicibacterium sp. A43C]